MKERKKAKAEAKGLAMRLAVFSDVHGNLVALEAVLADIEAQGGVDGYWGLGDLAALGPEPVAVLERLAQLPNACFTRRNTERYVVTGQRPSHGDICSIW